ncbi:MAG: DUF3352 domain-containing protein [Spirochaetales bacterium]|nr:DUF3352 domain-containing protein [Spirochaetales bacterium]
MAFGKKLLKFFLKFVLVIVIVLAVAAAGLGVYYLVTLRSAEEYLPAKFLFYVKIDSLKEIYENVLDLKAADVLFSQPEFKSVYRALLDFKSNEWARDPVLKKLLEMRASIVVHQDRSLSLVLEPGLLSLGTRNFALISAFLKVDNLNLTTTRKGDVTVYGIGFGSRDQFFFSVVDNLVLVSDKTANIESLYRNRTSGENLAHDKSLASVQGKLGAKGMLDLYVSTPTLINLALPEDSPVKRILSRLTLNDLSLLSLDLSNDELTLGLYSSFTPTHRGLASFLDYNPPPLQSLKYPPLSSSVYSALNVKSFKDLFELRLLLDNKDVEGTINQLDGVAKTFLGTGLDGLLWDWIGDEVGAFLTAGSDESVFFARVRDRAKLDVTFKKLVASNIFYQDSSLVFNDVRLSRIDFPDLLKGIIGLFVDNLTVPYFYITDDFIFFCMDPEVLAKAINDHRSEQVLIRSENFRQTTEAAPKNANLFLYYDLTRSKPPFFPADSLPGRLLRLYESGMIGVYYIANEIRVTVHARGISGRKTVPLAGYPKDLPKGTSGDVYSVDLYGSAVGELVYVNNDGSLVIQDLLSGAVSLAPLDPQSAVVSSALPGSRVRDIFTFSPSGALGKFEFHAQSVPPFPVITPFKNSFLPVADGADLLFYSRADRAFYLFPKAGGSEKKIEFQIDNPVLYPPDVRNGIIAYYPKNFEGDVFLISTDGKLIPGWSRRGGGISLSGPVFVDGPGGRARVAFLTQAGVLNLWELDGRIVSGFPVQLEGTYAAAPCPAERGRRPSMLAAINEAGKCALVSQTGEILKVKSMTDSGGRNAKLLADDVDRDGIDELFIYGGNNFVIGLDALLELLPGFPVTGGRRPAFNDVNLDGRKDMLTAGFDNRIYAYELNK